MYLWNPEQVLRLYLDCSWARGSQSSSLQLSWLWIPDFGCLVHLHHHKKECPCCSVEIPSALGEPPTKSPPEPEFGEGQWIYRRGEEKRGAVDSPVHVAKAFLLQVAWLSYGCNLVRIAVGDTPPKSSCAQLFLSAMLRLRARAAARLAARNMDKRQVSHRAGHTNCISLTTQWCGNSLGLYFKTI